MPLSTSNIQMSTVWLTDVVEINRRVRETLVTAADLTMTQYRILLELSVNDGHLMCGTLATLLFLSPAAITHAVDDLFRRGYVDRSIMDSNRRVTLVDINESGNHRLKIANDVLIEMLSRDAWSELNETQHQELVYSCSTAVGPFIGHTLLHDNVAIEPCYITCDIIQQQCYEHLLDEYKLSLNEFRIGLSLLGASNALRSTDLSEILLLKRSTTSRAIATLKEHRILTAEPSADDSRAINLILTSHGSQIIQDAFEHLTVLDNSICITQNSPSTDEMDMIGSLVYQSLKAASHRDRSQNNTSASHTA